MLDHILLIKIRLRFQVQVLSYNTVRFHGVRFFFLEAADFKIFFKKYFKDKQQ